MTTPNTSSAVKAIEVRYGGYSSKDIRGDVGRFLFRRFKDDSVCLDTTLEAIKEYHEIRFGPPDVAQINKAIDAYERQYGTKITKAPRTYAAPSEAEIEETRVDCKKLAAERGIDTNKPEWAAQYFYEVMAEQKAKEAEDTKRREE